MFCNFPRCAEIVAEWVSDCIGYMHKKDLKRIAATPQAEDTWTEHDLSLTAGMLFTESDSWFMGGNIPGKKKTFLLYAGGSPAYRAKCAEVATKGYEGFLLQ